MEELFEGVLEVRLRQLPAPIFITFHEFLLAHVEHLKAAQTHTEARGGARCALRHLLRALLSRCVVAVLSRAHLQVEDARLLELRRDVLQHQEVWKGKRNGALGVIN